MDKEKASRQEFIMGLEPADRMIHALRETVESDAIPELHYRELVNTLLAQARNSEFHGRILGISIIAERQRDIARNLREHVVQDKKFHVVDVGASDGWFAKQFLDDDFQGNVLCIEPILHQYEKLSEYCSTDERVSCLRSAVGDQVVESVELQVCENETGLSSLLPFAEDYHYFNSNFDQESRHTETVQCTTLDELLKDALPTGQENIALKIDTQGYELNVLNGAKRLFESGQVKAVLVEMVTQTKYAGGCNYDVLLNWLKDFGFEIFDILPFYWEDKMEFQERPKGRLTEFDCLMVKKDFL